jgi:hypothetical protein
MGNFFTQAFKGILGQESIVPDNHKLNGNIFYTIGSFFGYDLGGQNLAQYIKAYASNPLVYMIVNRIAVNSASIGRKYENSEGEEIENGELQELLENPNPGQGQIEFYETIYSMLLTTGNAFVHLIKSVGM